MQRLFLIVVAIVLIQSCNQNQEIISTSTKTVLSETEVIQYAELDTDRLLQTIAFGSCNEQSAPQRIWPTISKYKPDLWIWLGDNIYGDTENMSVMQEKYAQQLSHPEYQGFIQQVPIIGIWDDHDYGVNDGDRNYPKKEESKDLMLNFLNVPTEAEVRSRPGAFQAFRIGPANQEIKIILLDGRSFRDELVKGQTPTGRGYLPNEEGDILGETQWNWLEKQLTESNSKIHIIGCGIQMIPEEHRFEKWANFPKARKRLFELLAETQVANPILLSGDRHIAEISKLEVEGLDQAVYEVTASGMTHSYEGVGDEPNRHRISPLIGQKNFGLMQIDWSNPNEPIISLEVKGINDQDYARVEVE